MPSPRSIVVFAVVAFTFTLFYIKSTLKLLELDHAAINIIIKTIILFVSKRSPAAVESGKLVGRTLSSNTRKSFFRRIVAVGDLHGDFDAALTILHFSDVINSAGHWTGYADILVQTGDIMDRGTQVPQLFDLMERLRQEARDVGGVVLSVLGNHEIENLYAESRGKRGRDVASEEWESWGDTEQDAWENRQYKILQGDIAQMWTRSYNAAYRLPLHPSIGEPNAQYPPDTTPRLSGLTHEDVSDGMRANPLIHAALSFVHGGLSPGYPYLTPFPTRINQISKSLLRKLQRGETLKRRSPEYELIYNGLSPLWFRGWAQDRNENHVCSAVDKVLAKTGTRRMIMGHTIQQQGIRARCNGKIILIDTGMSRAFGMSRGPLSALEIEYSLYPVGVDLEERWEERELITALYPEGNRGGVYARTLVNDTRTIVGDFRVPMRRRQSL